MSVTNRSEDIISDWIGLGGIGFNHIISELSDLSESDQSKNIGLDQEDHIKQSRADYSKKSGEDI